MDIKKLLLTPSCSFKCFAVKTQNDYCIWHLESGPAPSKSNPVCSNLPQFSKALQIISDQILTQFPAARLWQEIQHINEWQIMKMQNLNYGHQ